MTFPTIHPNGTSAERLCDAYETAHDAVLSAWQAVRVALPHGRDYPQGDDAFAKAYDEHLSRLERLQSVMAELDELVGHCERARRKTC